MTSNRLSLLVVLAILLIPQLRAQTPPPNEFFAFRILGAGVIAEDLFYSSEGKIFAVRISTEMRSIYYNYTGPRGSLVFFRQLPGANGKLIRQPVAEVNLTGVGNRPLLVFIHHPSVPGTYAVRPFSDNAKDVAPGGFRFVNFTTRTMALKFGQQQLLIPSGEQLIVKGESSGGGSINEVQLFGVLLNDEIRQVYSNLWSYDPEMRSIVLISPTDLNATGVEVKCLGEHINQIPLDTKPPGGLY